MSVKDIIEKQLKEKAEEMQKLAEASHLATRLDEAMLLVDEIKKQMKGLGADLSATEKKTSQKFAVRTKTSDAVKAVLADGPLHYKDVHEIMKRSGFQTSDDLKNFGTMMAQFARKGLIDRVSHGVYGVHVEAAA